MSNRQVTDHMLQPKKGWFDGPPLDFQAKISANVTLAPVYHGRVVHVNSVGEFEMGATGSQVPILLHGASSDDPDIGTDQSTDAYGVITVKHRIGGLVCTGGFEVEDTEYDTTQTYLPNQPLRAVADNAGATGGRITNQGITIYTNCVLGFVSRGVQTYNGLPPMLAFWTHFLPGTTGN